MEARPSGAILIHAIMVEQIAQAITERQAAARAE